MALCGFESGHQLSGTRTDSSLRRTALGERAMNYYHYTSRLHLPAIEREGVIRTTESNFDATLPHAAPDVVWLLDTQTVEHGHGLGEVKTDIRITVDVPAVQWLDWGYTYRMEPWWRAAFIEAGGGFAAADHWYVYSNSIPRSQWIKVEQVAPVFGLLPHSKHV